MLRFLCSALLCLALVAAAARAAPPTQPADYRLAKVRILARVGAEAVLRDARITGSNEGATNGFVELARISEAPAAGQWLELPVPADKVCRWVKIEAAGDALLEAAEVEFYSASGRLAGKGFGTAGAKDKTDTAFDKALDGKPQTAFKAEIDHAYVGLDLGQECQAPTPRFSLKTGAYKDAHNVTLDVWPPARVTYRYTIDGSRPSASHGEVYQGALTVDKSMSIAAIAVQEGRADSSLAIASYIIGAEAAAQPLVKSYHIGNSLTDTVDNNLEPVVLSAGRNYQFLRKTIPGCGLEGNWESNGKGFGATDYQKVLAGGVDHLFLQVFPNPPGVERDTNAGVNFMNLAQQGNAKAQVWLYAQWPAWKGWKTDAHCVGASWMKPQWFPNNRKPADWEQAMANKMEYYRLILKNWNAANKGRPALMCPGGPALVRLKKAIEAGEVPGMKDFAAATFSDDLHLAPAGRYLVSLVHYGCMFKESPEGKVTFAMSGLSAQQAAVYQKIAWETVQAEPEAGVK